MKILSLLAETELSPAELRLIREMVDAKLKAVETRELDAARVLALWGILRDAQQAVCSPQEREFLGTEAPESSLALPSLPGRALLARATLRWALSWPQAHAVVALRGDIPGFIQEIDSMCKLVGIQTKYQDYLPGHNGRLLVPGISPIYMCDLGEGSSAEQIHRWAGRFFAFQGIEAGVNEKALAYLGSLVRGNCDIVRFRRIVSP